MHDHVTMRGFLPFGSSASCLYINHGSGKGIEMMNIILGYLLAVNITSFLLYGIDKYKAKKGRWRISEATLLLMAVIGGSIGAWGGMRIWHHKTMHKMFKYGIPVIIIFQVALAIYLHTIIL